MANYLDYIPLASKYMNIVAGAMTIGANQSFKLKLQIKVAMGTVRILGNSANSSGIAIVNSSSLVLTTTGGANNTITIPIGSGNFRTFEIWRDDGTNVNIRIDNGGVVTVAQAGGFAFNRMFANNSMVSPGGLSLHTMSLELDGALTNNWENTTGTGTTLPDTIGTLSFSQVGTWPADNSEWIPYVEPVAATHFLRMDGVDDVVSLSGISVNFGIDSYMFAFKGVIRELPVSGQRGLYGVSSTNTQGAVYNSTGQLTVFQSNVSAYTSTSGFIIAGELHDYVVEHDSSGAYRFFRDNVLITSGTYTNDSAGTINRIGQHNSTTPRAALDFYSGYVTVGGIRREWSPSLSNGTGNTLFSVGNVNNGTLSNFTTVDSDKWISLGAAVILATLKYWTGAAWVRKPLKYWNGSAWVQKVLKYWDGTTWVSK